MAWLSYIEMSLGWLTDEDDEDEGIEANTLLFPQFVPSAGAMLFVEHVGWPA